MAFSLTDMLRWFAGGDKKEKPLFKTDKEALDFVRNAYKTTGGVSPELRRSFEFYRQHYNESCERPAGPLRS